MLLPKDFKFIDLFAGIGGFHCAMSKYSDNKAQCVMASEIDENARLIYENNFKIKPLGDIRKINQSDIKEPYDVVCGGFPCQTFSKAGMQKGFGDPRGTLFKEIIRLISKDKLDDQPKILILENVRNLITHDKGITWNTIRKELIDAGYNVANTPVVVGPKDFGIPQLRERAIILAIRKDIFDGEINFDIEKKSNNSTSIYSVVNETLDSDSLKKYKISKHEEDVLTAWDEFIHLVKYAPFISYKEGKKKYIKKEFNGVLGFPIWAFEFKKRYNINNEQLKYPEWKKDFITKNRLIYSYNKKAIDEWLKKWKMLKEFTHTEQKFEWQVGNSIDTVWEGIIQFRPSGVRVKQPTESPTLVAMVHVPIIGKYKRYITVAEAAKLQSFPLSYNLSLENDFNAYKQLGNAVNVEVIYQVFKKFVNYIDEKTEGRF